MNGEFFPFSQIKAKKEAKMTFSVQKTKL